MPHSFCRSSRTLRAVSLAALFAVALALRLVGITWGLPSPEFPLVSQSDEWLMMGALQSLDYAHGQFTPLEAHIEGTLLYYVWQAVFVAAKALGYLGGYPGGIAPHAPDYPRMVLLGRLVGVAFDLGGVALVYLTLRRMRLRWGFAWLGAAILAVLPFEVVYSHFMRNHIPANFFVALAMYLTVGLAQTLGWRTAALAGVAVGLGVATKYSTLLAVSLPVSALLYDELVGKRKLRLGPAAACGAVCGPRLVALCLGLAAAFFAADPMLFLDFRNAAGPIARQLLVADFGQFSSGALANLGKLWEYVAVVLPAGYGPFLWPPLYAGFVAAALLPGRRAHSLPLVFFCLVVLYFMGKGYFYRAEFVRTLLMVFAPMSALAAMACAALWNTLRARAAKTAFVAAACFCLGATLVYDAAYVRGMTLPDPRRALFDHFQKVETDRPVRIGIVTTSWMSDSIASSLRLLKTPEKAVVTSLLPESPPELYARQDVLCLVDFMRGDAEVVRKELERLTADGRFRLEARIGNPLSFAGVTFDDEALPHDMAYPFPKFYLLRAVLAGGGT